MLNFEVFEGLLVALFEGTSRTRISISWTSLRPCFISLSLTLIKRTPWSQIITPTFLWSSRYTILIGFSAYTMIFVMLVSLEFRSLVPDKFLIITNEFDSFLTLYKIISVNSATQTILCDLETLIHVIGWRLVLFCWGLMRTGYFQSSPAKTYNIPSIARIVHLQVELTQKVYDSVN